LTRIPVWIVDDDEETHNWEGALIKVYSRTDGQRMRLADVVEGARKGTAGWGIKGTRHVALVSSEGKEIELEKVTPRMEWGVWAAGGKPCSRNWKVWPETLRLRFEELKVEQEKERLAQLERKETAEAEARSSGAAAAAAVNGSDQARPTSESSASPPVVSAGSTSRSDSSRAAVASS
jgi:hypothetical protein